MESSEAGSLTQPSPLEHKPKRSGQRWRGGYRKIVDLEWAELIQPWEKAPHSPGKLRGTRAEGKAYEHRFGRQIERWTSRRDSPLYEGEIIGRTWIKFEDAHGFGWAEPDHLVLQEDVIWLFECKRTHSTQAEEQLLGLYAPLLAELWPGLAQIRIEVCKNLGAGTGGRIPRRIRSLDDIYEREQEIYILHWL